MSTIRPWTVNHPGPLTQLSPRLWIIEDFVPGLEGPGRRMSIVRREDGTLLFFNAIPVPDATLDAIRTLGSPTTLIIPTQVHSLDVAAFAARLGLESYAPRVAIEALRPKLVCRPIETLPLGIDLQVFTVDGFKTHEIALVAGETLLTGDVVTNVPHRKGARGLLLRLVNFTGPGPRLPHVVRWRVGRDLKKVKALLERIAEVPGLERIVPSHGQVIESGAREALRSVAASLK